MKKFGTERIIGVAVSLAMLLGVTATSATPSVAASCGGAVVASATWGAQASYFMPTVSPWNFTSGSIDAYYPGVWKAGRSRCISGIQRITIVHQAYKFDPRYNQWVPWYRYSRAANVYPGGNTGSLAFGAYQAPLNLAARVTVYWQGGGRTYKRVFTPSYYCPNTYTCQVANGYIQYL